MMELFITFINHLFNCLTGMRIQSFRENIEPGLTEAIRESSISTPVADGASSSSTASGSTYEVFLSFRGEDTRLNFTDHLYKHLTDVGVQTFRDNEELDVGGKIDPVLMKAIHESSISIPIFSENYATSKWCLRELTHMVKRMKSNNGHTICPIFFGVTPANVKHQTGSFEEAFLKHTKEVHECTVQKWKDALKEVAELKGWEKDKIANGHEAELIKKIVTEVCMKLKKSHVCLTDDLVGMNYHMEEITKLLDIESGSGAQIVGIHGMGGIGKTTIAKFMYNQLCDHFQHQCTFVEDVREKVKHNGSCDGLQKQLISDVLKRSVGIDLDIQHAFRNKKVLIVLDDVEDKPQLNKIIGSPDYFGPGSRIIVTTRNKDTFEGDLIYGPKEMNGEDSLLLFCKHAFKSTQPREGYEDISREVVQTAAGLPLSLVVIGSMLYKEELEKWEDTLEKLIVIPPNKVQERLKLSYDKLNLKQKKMFLDIACHFIGEDKTNAVYMWEDCNLFPKSEGIDVLVSLSLITIEKLREAGGDKDVNVFRMHDHLRDLGREIVFQENEDDPGKRSRLWSLEDAQEVLNRKSGTGIVETFYMKSGWDSDCISNDDLEGLSSLRYLHLEGSELTGDFKKLASNLRWFRLFFKDPTARHHLGNFRMPLTIIFAKKLVILDLSRSDISDGWESWIQIKEATNLKVLKLSRCRHLTKPPECLWDMKSLVELDLSDTGITELPEQGIGNLTNLTSLLLRFSMIKRLPDAIGKLKKLQVLDCSWCSSLEGEVPSGIGKLSSLRVLELCNTEVDTLPEDISSLCNLRILDLRYASNIKKLPRLGIENLKNLEVLDCSDCWALEGQLPEEIWNLTSLVSLFFNETKISCRLPKDISGLSHLAILKLYRCEIPAEELKLPLSLTTLAIALTEVSFNAVRSLVNLNYLEFYKYGRTGHCCDPVEEVAGVEMLSKLEDLWLAGFDDHMKSCRLLPAMKFDSFSRLKYLYITGCRFGTLPTGSLDLSNCQMLGRLEIKKCHEMKMIADFGKLGSTWEHINIDECNSLEVLLLPDLSSMKRLKMLSVVACPELREIKGLEALTTLQELSVELCPLLNKDHLQQDLSNSKSLKIFWDRQYIQ